MRDTRPANRASRRYPVGAEIDGSFVHFRVWAPDRRRVAVALEGAGEHALTAEEDGYFAGAIRAAVGTRYHLRLDGGEPLFPDPASRFQPEGPHGPSEVVDSSLFEWTDGDWRGCAIKRQVVYEMHVGTFTPEGTWAAAAEKLPLLRDVGITLIEMMPVNDFAGRFGWGYDGVNLFAPTRLYGPPDDLRRFVDRAHALGLGVILDVVYNHLGPDGNYLARFARDYFTDRHPNEWGEAINFDGPNSGPVRAFFAASAACWIDEFHFDGLRLDATQSMHDASPRHIVAEIAAAARAAAGSRRIVLIGENEPQDSGLLRGRDGTALDGLWNDDFHHSAMVALTGRREAYYVDHRGTPQELISAAKYGFLFQGQRYAHQDKPRGAPALDIGPAAFVNFIQNHDQIANSARGERFHRLTSPGRARALTALLLLMPGTPMLFQGQEFGASSPFLFFADHRPDLAQSVRDGRHGFLKQFASLADPAAQERLDIPNDMATFERCRLDWREFYANAETVALHRDLIALRRDDAAIASGRVDGAVIGAEAFLLRFFHECDDRLLLVNLGRDFDRASIAEPLAAPPPGAGWLPVWSSEDPRYGGGGTPPVEHGAGWTVPGHAAVLMRAAAPADRP